MQLEFEADFAVDYDFRNNLRYGTGAYPEPGPEFEALKKDFAEGRASREDLDYQIGLYSEYFALYPELKP